MRECPCAFKIYLAYTDVVWSFQVLVQSDQDSKNLYQQKQVVNLTKQLNN